MADNDEDVLVWEATEAVTFDHGGLSYSIVPGNPGTTFAAGHPVLAAYPQYFKPFTPNYDWAAPRSQSKAADRGARSR
jgi:hypothetical protein